MRERRREEEQKRLRKENQEKENEERENAQKRKRKISNETEWWKEIKMAKRRQKAAVEEVVRKNKEAKEEMAKEGRVRKETMEKEFQDKIDLLEMQRHCMIVWMDQELQEKLLEKLAKQHKVENLDMVEIMLGHEDEEGGDEEAGEAEKKAAPQALAAPDCPICYELMSPPTRIFHCGAGHLVCGTCRPRIQVFHPYFSGGTNS